MFDRMKEQELERVRQERDFWKHRALKLQARRKKSAAFAYNKMCESYNLQKQLLSLRKESFVQKLKGVFK